MGDNPLTDLLVHGLHPFPQDIEEMLLRLRDTVPRYLDRIDFDELSDWAGGRNLDAGRAHLRTLLAQYEIDLAKLIR
ncbi:MAG: hypothetical protein WCP68_09145 [Enhydrobacter sp.]